VAAAVANGARNDLPVAGLVADLFHPEALLAEAPYDLVIAADVLYEERLVDAMLDVLPRLATEAVFADPGRLTSEHFLERCDEQWERDSYERDRVMLHHLRLRA
jgi:predicted nicotinamide N-methyase